ncbi:hypothetical protein ACHAW6_008847 [Cyclotella cf. meneghiniana]
MMNRRAADPCGAQPIRKGDEESLLQTPEKSYPEPASPSSPSILESGSSTASAVRANPTLYAKLIARKVFTILSSDEDETAPSAANGYGIITLLKDITIGTIFGVLTISFLIFLDHINVIHLQSAHNFRQSAFSVLNDPETLATLEESAGLKFIPIGDYEAMKNEIDAAAAKVAKVKDTIAERIKETEQKKAELEPLKAEYEKLLKESKLELDKWCGECSWMGRTNCDMRKQYFIDQYGNTEILSKVAIMKQSPGCKKAD